MVKEGLLGSWLLFVEGGQFGFRVSFYAEEMLLTFVDQCGTLRCLLRVSRKAPVAIAIKVSSRAKRG